jgi:hypothetical protein
MGVSFEKFRKWAEKRFDEIVVRGGEIRTNSIFDKTDDNNHLWMSPAGGKKKRPFGVYHCFKTDSKGSLVKLVQIVDDLDRDDAIRVLKGHTTVREMEWELEKWFQQEDEAPPPPPVPKLNLPEGSFLIDSLPSNSWWKEKALEYLVARKIPSEGLYICTEKPYKARIIIPYYDENGQLIYWNGRHFGSAKAKYLGPPKECGVGKSDVIFVPGGKMPPPGSTIHICEGEFNAISLTLSGLYAAACGGKNMSERQALMFREYNVVLCLDRDKAGTKGTESMSDMVSKLLIALGDKEKLQFVQPPQNIGGKKKGDWNDMFVVMGPNVTRAYIEKMKKPLDFQAPMGMVGDYFRYLEL